MLKHNNGGFIIELPEENELVVAVIKKIMPYGAFCVLPEYQDMEAFMHISEVAPRWIKNIHEFISEGQRHVAKVHHIDREKRQVDISLKRVNEEEKKVKLESMKIEKKPIPNFPIGLNPVAANPGNSVRDSSLAQNEVPKSSNTSVNT